jgi:hypothetical protein
MKMVMTGRAGSDGKLEIQKESNAPLKLGRRYNKPVLL